MTTPMPMDARTKVSNQIKRAAQKLGQKLGAVTVQIIVVLPGDSPDRAHVIDGGVSRGPQPDVPALYRQVADAYGLLKEKGEGWVSH